MENAGQQRSDDSRLGAYQIIRQLARGGMAELFLARTTHASGFEKVVALKKILPKYANRSKYVSLFCDEARLAASLNHANIVQVYDIGLDGGNYFFAMEYLHGQDVRTLLHRAWAEGEKMPIRFAIQIATQVAAALHYAHEMRRPDGSLVDIVHRDVSPSNIIVTYDGAVKLLDFGVAKAATRTVKTRTGTLKGKISYMSPEQAKGAIVDRRSDIFSLGIVLWEMVTTTRLFRAENDLATLQLIINVPPKKPSEVRPDCPPELERIVLKALSQDITNRYQTADELVQDLEAFARTNDMGPSATALSVYVSELFTAEINSWNEAKAAGVPLAEHLTHIGDMTEPVMESEFIELMDLPAMLAREEAAQDSGADDDDDDDQFDEKPAGDEDDDDDEDDEQSTLIPAPVREEANRFDTPAAKPPARSPTMPPPRPPVVPPRADKTPPPTKPPAIPPARPDSGRVATVPPRTPTAPPRMSTPAGGARAASEGTETGPTIPSLPAGMLDTIPAAAIAPTAPAKTIDEPPPIAGSNPWTVAKTPSGGLRAWASGSFPAKEIPRETVGKWERRGLVVTCVILGLILIASIISQCTH